MAESVGFEPTVPFGITSFQDWLLKPLGQLSMLVNHNTSKLKSQQNDYRPKKFRTTPHRTSTTRSMISNAGRGGLYSAFPV